MPKLAAKKSARAVPKISTSNVEQVVRQTLDDQPPTPLNEIPWGHNIVLLFKLSDPAPQSDLAQQSLKDPYLFDFLTLHDVAIERDLETGLVDHIQKVLAGTCCWFPEPLKGSLPSIEEIDAELALREFDDGMIQPDDVSKPVDDSPRTQEV